jgi:hypothetical protein
MNDTPMEDRIWFRPPTGGFLDTEQAAPPWYRDHRVKRKLMLYGRCRSGKRWFWSAYDYRTTSDAELIERHGWAETEAEALTAARTAIIDLAGNDYVVASQVQGTAAWRLQEINKTKRAARPVPDTSDAHAVEYLYRAWRHGHDLATSVEVFRIVKQTKERIFYVKLEERSHRWDGKRWIIEKPSHWHHINDEIGFITCRDLDRRDLHHGSYYWTLSDAHLKTAPRLWGQAAESTPENLAELKAAMATAHPDRGGSNAAFIEARKRYVEARRRARTSAKGERV